MNISLETTEENDEGRAIDQTEIIDPKFTSAKQLWDQYMDGERDMRVHYSLMNKFSESLENYKKYYEYRFQSTNNSVARNLETNTAAHVTSLLYEMSRDPNLSSFLVVQVLPFGANTNFIHKTNGESMVHQLARYGNIDAMSCIFTLLSDVKCGIQNKQGQTPLILACISHGAKYRSTSSNKIKAAKLLLERKDCNINHIDLFERNALFYSFQELNMKTFRYLLKNHASVVSTLSLYTLLVPELLPLDRALKHGLTPQLQIQNVRDSVNLRKFLSHDEVSNDMLDFNESYARLMLKVATLGKLSVMKGMLFFKIRDELRQLKLMDPPITNNKFEVREVAPPLIDTYDRDLKIRDKFKAQRKQEKSDAVRLRKERDVKKEWDEKRAKTSARLEKEFDVKIQGLFV